MLYLFSLGLITEVRLTILNRAIRLRRQISDGTIGLLNSVPGIIALTSNMRCMSIEDQYLCTEF